MLGEVILNVKESNIRECVEKEQADSKRHCDEMVMENNWVEIAFCDGKKQDNNAKDDHKHNNSVAHNKPISESESESDCEAMRESINNFMLDLDKDLLLYETDSSVHKDHTVSLNDNITVLPITALEKKYVERNVVFPWLDPGVTDIQNKANDGFAHLIKNIIPQIDQFATIEHNYSTLRSQTNEINKCENFHDKIGDVAANFSSCNLVLDNLSIKRSDGVADDVGAKFAETEIDLFNNSMCGYQLAELSDARLAANISSPMCSCSSMSHAVTSCKDTAYTMAMHDKQCPTNIVKSNKLNYNKRCHNDIQAPLVLHYGRNNTFDELAISSNNFIREEPFVGQAFQDFCVALEDGDMCDKCNNNVRNTNLTCDVKCKKHKKVVTHSHSNVVDFHSEIFFSPIGDKTTYGTVNGNENNRENIPSLSGVNNFNINKVSVQYDSGHNVSVKPKLELFEENIKEDCLINASVNYQLQLEEHLQKNVTLPEDQHKFKVPLDKKPHVNVQLDNPKQVSITSHEQAQISSHKQAQVSVPTEEQIFTFQHNKVLAETDEENAIWNASTSASVYNENSSEDYLVFLQSNSPVVNEDHHYYSKKPSVTLHYQTKNGFVNRSPSVTFQNELVNNMTNNIIKTPPKDPSSKLKCGIKYPSSSSTAGDNCLQPLPLFLRGEPQVDSSGLKNPNLVKKNPIEIDENIDTILQNGINNCINENRYNLDVNKTKKSSFKSLFNDIKVEDLKNVDIIALTMSPKYEGLSDCANISSCCSQLSGSKINSRTRSAITTRSSLDASNSIKINNLAKYSNAENEESFWTLPPPPTRMLARIGDLTKQHSHNQHLQLNACDPTSDTDKGITISNYEHRITELQISTANLVKSTQHPGIQHLLEESKYTPEFTDEHGSSKGESFIQVNGNVQNIQVPSQVEDKGYEGNKSKTIEEKKYMVDFESDETLKQNENQEDDDKCKHFTQQVNVLKSAVDNLTQVRRINKKLFVLKKGKKYLNRKCECIDSSSLGHGAHCLIYNKKLHATKQIYLKPSFHNKANNTRKGKRKKYIASQRIAKLGCTYKQKSSAGNNNAEMLLVDIKPTSEVNKVEKYFFTFQDETIKDLTLVGDKSCKIVSDKSMVEIDDERNSGISLCNRFNNGSINLRNVPLKSNLGWATKPSVDVEAQDSAIHINKAFLDNQVQCTMEKASTTSLMINLVKDERKKVVTSLTTMSEIKQVENIESDVVNRDKKKLRCDEVKYDINMIDKHHRSQNWNRVNQKDGKDSIIQPSLGSSIDNHNYTDSIFKTSMDRGHYNGHPDNEHNLLASNMFKQIQNSEEECQKAIDMKDIFVKPKHDHNNFRYNNGNTSVITLQIPEEVQDNAEKLTERLQKVEFTLINVISTFPDYMPFCNLNKTFASQSSEIQNSRQDFLEKNPFPESMLLINAFFDYRHNQLLDATEKVIQELLQIISSQPLPASYTIPEGKDNVCKLQNEPSIKEPIANKSLLYGKNSLSFEKNTSDIPNFASNKLLTRDIFSNINIHKEETKLNTRKKSYSHSSDLNKKNKKVNISDSDMCMKLNTNEETNLQNIPFTDKHIDLAVKLSASAAVIKDSDVSHVKGTSSLSKKCQNLKHTSVKESVGYPYDTNKNKFVKKCLFEVEKDKSFRKKLKEKPSLCFINRDNISHWNHEKSQKLLLEINCKSEKLLSDGITKQNGSFLEPCICSGGKDSKETFLSMKDIKDTSSPLKKRELKFELKHSVCNGNRMSYCRGSDHLNLQHLTDIDSVTFRDFSINSESRHIDDSRLSDESSQQNSMSFSNDNSHKKPNLSGGCSNIQLAIENKNLQCKHDIHVMECSLPSNNTFLKTDNIAQDIFKENVNTSKALCANGYQLNCDRNVCELQAPAIIKSRPVRNTDLSKSDFQDYFTSAFNYKNSQFNMNNDDHDSCNINTKELGLCRSNLRFPDIASSNCKMHSLGCSGVNDTTFVEVAANHFLTSSVSHIKEQNVATYVNQSKHSLYQEHVIAKIDGHTVMGVNNNTVNFVKDSNVGMISNSNMGLSHHYNNSNANYRPLLPDNNSHPSLVRQSSCEVFVVQKETLLLGNSHVQNNSTATSRQQNEQYIIKQNNDCFTQGPNRPALKQLEQQLELELKNLLSKIRENPELESKTVEECDREICVNTKYRTHICTIDPDHRRSNIHRNLLPRMAIKIMERWYEQNIKNPYPSQETAQVIAQSGGINIEQVKKWFANKRMRNGNTRKVCTSSQVKRPIDVLKNIAKKLKFETDENEHISKN